MSKVKIQGNASGTGVVTLTAPNTNTDRIITLPDSTGSILDSTSTLDATKLSGALPAISAASLTNIPAANITGTLPAIDGSALTGRPIFKVKKTTGNQNITNNTNTVVTFDSTVYDSDSFYNTSTNKFQPTQAGYYFLNLVLRLHGESDFDIFDVRITKNGSVAVNGSYNQIRYTTGAAAGIVYFNGSTDYAQPIVYLGSAFPVRGNYPDTLFEGFFIRS